MIYESLWVVYCNTCGHADVSRSSASRPSSLRGAAQHIEDWKGIDERAKTPRGEHDVQVVEYVRYEPLEDP